MSIVGRLNKQPAEREDCNLDFAAEWLDGGDRLFEVELKAITCETDPEDTSLTVDEPIEFSASTAKVWVNGGTSGNAYKVEVLAMSETGRIAEAEIKVKVKEI